MKFRFHAIAPTAMLSFVGMLVSGTPAHAAFALFLSDASCAPGCNVTIVDNGGGDFDPTTGSMLVNQTVGTFSTNLVSSVSKPILAQANISASSTHVTSSGAGLLTLRLTDTSFTMGGLGGLVQQLSITGLTGNLIAVTAKGYEDNTNTQFGLGGSSTSTLTCTATPCGLQSSVGISATTPFSLTEVVTIQFGAGGGSVNLTAALGTVPEPTSVALLGGILLVAGTAVRRKLRRG